MGKLWQYGDTELYPLARVSIEVDGRPLEVEAAVSGTLPMGVLLGMDNPELVNMLVAEERQSTEDTFVTHTRAVDPKRSTTVKMPSQKQCCHGGQSHQRTQSNHREDGSHQQSGSNHQEDGSFNRKGVWMGGMSLGFLAHLSECHTLVVSY